MTAEKTEVEEWRDLIDFADECIVSMLCKRALFARKIALLKRAQGLPLRDEAREAVVLAGVPERMRPIFEAILAESRRIMEQA